MAVPDYEAMMRPVLEAFAAGATSVSDTLPRLKVAFEIRDEDAEELLPSGRTTVLSSRAHWARTYLAGAGCLTSPKRNVHAITERGRGLLASHAGPISNEVLSRFPDFVAWLDRARRRENGVEPGKPIEPAVPAARATPDDQIETAFMAIEQALVGDLLSAIQSMSPTRFEQLIVDLLVRMGYGGGDPTMGERLGRSGDGGIDGVINEDALGLDAVYVQAKRYAPDNRIGRPALQAFVGSLTGEGATKGVFVTTSDFSREARDYLNRVQHRIVLIDGERLARLLIQHEVGVRARKTYVLRSVDEDRFIEG